MITQEYCYLGRSAPLESPGGYRYYVLLYGKSVPDMKTGIHSLSLRLRLACNVLSSFYGWATAGYARAGGTDVLSWNLKYKPNQEWNTTVLKEGGVSYPSWIDLGEGSAQLRCGYGADTGVELTWGYKMQSTNSAGWFPESGVWAEGTLQVILPAILGATMPTVTGEGLLGSPLTVTMDPVDEGYTHSLRYEFGTLSGAIGENLGNEAVWTPPLELAAAIPNAPGGTLKLFCATYSGADLIGTEQEAQVALRVPQTLAPTLDVHWSDAAGLAVPARYLSALTVEGEVTTAYGAVIKSRSLTLGGKPYSGGILEEAGERELALTVTDSRGLTATWQEMVTVLPYEKPTLRLDASRWSAPDETGQADEMGEYARVTLSGTVFALPGMEAVISLTYGSGSLEISMNFDEIQQNSTIFEEIRYISAPSAGTVGLKATLSDGWFDTDAAMTLSIGYATMDFLRGGKGVALGTTATAEGFECAMDARFTGSVSLPAPLEPAHAATKAYVDSALPAAPADFIQETGSEGVWTWRKWHSGYLELEGREALKSFSSLNGSGGIYFGVVGAWTYPFALTELSTVSFGFQTTKSNAWFWGEGVSTTGITNSYVGRGSNVSVAGYPTVRVTGRWK